MLESTNLLPILSYKSIVHPIMHNAQSMKTINLVVCVFTIYYLYYFLKCTSAYKDVYCKTECPAIQKQPHTPDCYVCLDLLELSATLLISEELHER